MDVKRQPSSSGVSPVDFNGCIESMLKFILESSINESLGFDLGFSKPYCSTLLKPDPSDPYLTTAPSSDILEGVPLYPLYKHLASALCRSITSGAVVYRVDDKMPMSSVHEGGSSLKQRECEWNCLIMEKGSALVNMLKSVDFELHVQEPFFSQLKDGRKTIEGRCAIGDYNRLQSGALILFNKCLLVQVQDVHWYASFSDMLQSEGLAKVLPGVETIEEGIQIYRSFYSEAKEQSKGVFAICVRKQSSQLYDPLVTILAELGYDGVQRLMGLAHTAGTITQALPPPRSVLLSSFSLPFNPDVKSSTLMDGTRALAKHVNRSSDRFWGSLVGSESDKNMLALDVVGHLVAHCCWMNVHIVVPHGAVFEIRIRDGYGARWSLDGTKFIGFLEPYMVDGHQRGWKH